MNLYQLCAAMLGLSAFVLVDGPTQSRAWNAEGHRIVALLAEHLLQTQSPPVQKKIGDILATDKSNDWTKTDIASEATWADAPMRSWRRARRGEWLRQNGTPLLDINVPDG